MQHSTSRQRGHQIVDLIKDRDADYEEVAYAPNVVVYNGRLGALLSSRPTAKDGTGWSVSQGALRELWEALEDGGISELVILLLLDGEEVYRILEANELVNDILRAPALHSKNGGGTYYWIDKDGTVVPAQRQRKHLRLSGDFLSCGAMDGTR